MHEGSEQWRMYRARHELHVVEQLAGEDDPTANRLWLTYSQLDRLPRPDRSVLGR
jgi:hypothetical protein